MGSDDDAEFLRALEDLQGLFHGQEEKGESLYASLANFLDASFSRFKGLVCGHRPPAPSSSSSSRRPSSEAVKLTCGKFLLSSIVLNLTLPIIYCAMYVGGKLFNARLCYTYGLFTKALVPVTRCISDFGERSVHPVKHYLDGINFSLRLLTLTSAVFYFSHLRKKVARIHVRDTLWRTFVVGL